MFISEKGSSKWKKKRGYYFFGIENSLGEKYDIPRKVIHQLRKDVIHYKLSYEDIFKKYAEKAYRSANLKVPLTNTLATKITNFLRSATREQLDDITRLTKYDWDYTETKYSPSTQTE